ncbi:putative F-box/kelch-repeat protein [Tripterygium wilfordii]|uniref:Putative F-box/kelch-repeat protein n=1 Tax=Tripterygium wilfordii TaxID=458696 RepID=A0A7J7D3I0_TRIWF|nr:putative F-box/kelch-repeat protein [Tripterygium wilfordii]
MLCGFSQGWLIMADDAAIITLFNPLNGAHIQLPPVCPYDIIYDERSVRYVHKAILSSSPHCSSSDYNVLVICGEQRELAYYNARTESWTELQKEAGFYYEDIMSFKGELCAVDEYGKLVLINPNSSQKIKVIVEASLLEGQNLYLMDLFGKLCLIVRYRKIEDFQTYRFKVMLQLGGKWQGVKGIGQCEVLLGYNRSMVLYATKVEGVLKDNRICFTDRRLVNNESRIGFADGFEFGILYLEDYNMEQIIVWSG